MPDRTCNLPPRHQTFDLAEAAKQTVDNLPLAKVGDPGPGSRILAPRLGILVVGLGSWSGLGILAPGLGSWPCCHSCGLMGRRLSRLCPRFRLGELGMVM